MRDSIQVETYVARSLFTENSNKLLYIIAQGQVLPFSHVELILVWVNNRDRRGIIVANSVTSSLH